MVASVGAGRDRKVLQRLWMHLSWQIVLVWKVRKSNADGSIAADVLGRSRARRDNEDSVSASPRGEEGSGTLTSLKDLRSRREELSARHDRDRKPARSKTVANLEKPARTQRGPTRRPPERSKSAEGEDVVGGEERRNRPTDLSTRLRERREQRASKQRGREAAKAAEYSVDLSHRTADNLNRRLQRRRSMDRDMKAMLTVARNAVETVWQKWGRIRG